MNLRLRLLIDVAKAVAAAHGIGVLHKDLKPANILIVPAASGAGWQIKIADFGSASLFDPARLQALGITNLGFTQTASSEAQILSGTVMYLAPEVLAGQSPSAGADVYALGVLMYQLVIGDFRKPLAPGWESEISDPLLREDIANAASGDPEKRLSSAAELAERLETLEQRRSRRDELESARLRAAIAERKLGEARARRPWVIVAVVTLAVGLGVSFTMYRRAAQEADHANHQTANIGRHSISPTRRDASGIRFSARANMSSPKSSCNDCSPKPAIAASLKSWFRLMLMALKPPPIGANWGPVKIMSGMAHRELCITRRYKSR
jgi:eukaryotic-like serine/threonine-protein kinase